MHHHHHPPTFVALSLLVAIFGSWTALDLFRRMRSDLGGNRPAWLTVAAAAMGLSIWSMHFVAMLGFDPGAAVAYDPGLTLASLVLPIAGTGAAFSLAARRRGHTLWLLASGAAMGVSICLMHYLGMAAVRTAFSLSYAPSSVAAALGIAVVTSTAALFFAGRDHSLSWRLAAAVVLGLAISGMHYAGMAGLRLTPLAGAIGAPAGAPPYGLAISVAAGTLLILFMALLASLYDQRGNVLSALDAGGVGYWELDTRTRVLRLSARAKQILGFPAEAEVSYDDLSAKVHPDDAGQREQAFQSSLRTGAEYDVEYRLRDEMRWVNVRGRLVDRRAMRLAGVVLDVTDRQEAFAAVSESERRQSLLIDELNHRVKNTLATIQSIAVQTGKDAKTVEEFCASFEGRLVALSSTHEALTRGGWETASLHELLEREMRPYRQDQVSLKGKDIEIGPRHALSLGMVFHELATNAVKYGALSVEGGTVTVAWRVERHAEGEVLVVQWTERGGPPARPPSRKGFGSRLIAMSVEHTLHGTLEKSFGRAGLTCVLRTPLVQPRQLDAKVGRLGF
jgi:PAS domain S-box-containing protein